jgi:5-methylcytosine-specific restriction endonuclease McrA
MADSTRERVRRHRALRRTEGAQRIDLWCDIEALALMDRVRQSGESISEVVHRALMALAREQQGDVRGQTSRAREPVTRSTSLSPKKRFAIMLAYGFRCVYCGRTPATDGITLTIDHMDPVQAGGSQGEENLVPACEACNRGKGGRSILPE